MGQGLVSIIIPVYNQSQALAKALDSVFAQTYKNIEVIVVNDGSQEDVGEKIKRLKDYKIIFERQEHTGANAARNRGFALSKGDYVIFWDADVVGEPDMLEKMMQALEGHPEASYAYSNFRLEQGKKMKGQVFDAEALWQRNFIHTTSLIRRADFLGFDESIQRFQDWDLWLTMLEQGKSGVWIDEELFRIITKGAMSQWLPRFAYHAPWKYLPWVSGKVKAYEAAYGIIQSKHNINQQWSGG